MHELMLVFVCLVGYTVENGKMCRSMGEIEEKHGDEWGFKRVLVVRH